MSGARRAPVSGGQAVKMRAHKIGTTRRTPATARRTPLPLSLHSRHPRTPVRVAARLWRMARRVAAILMLLAVTASSQRTAHLPRPELERPGAGAAEGALGASSALFDTVAVGSRAPLPPSISPGAAFLFKPSASATTVSGGAFTPDVRGDYVLQ